jgi:hypothetical protein
MSVVASIGVVAFSCFHQFFTGCREMAAPFLGAMSVETTIYDSRFGDNLDDVIEGLRVLAGAGSWRDVRKCPLLSAYKKILAYVRGHRLAQMGKVMRATFFGVQF